MSVDVGEGPRGLEVEIPKVLIPADELRAVVQGPDYGYGVAAHGQRFLVKRPVDTGGRSRIHVLLTGPSMLE